MLDSNRLCHIFLSHRTGAYQQRAADGATGLQGLKVRARCLTAEDVGASPLVQALLGPNASPLLQGLLGTNASPLLQGLLGPTTSRRNGGTLSRVRGSRPVEEALGHWDSRCSE